jgi:RHS repeat-associated protein
MRGPANGRRYREFRHMIGFNGVVHEPRTHWQLLGNGQRAYNPILVRFHNPDRLSPFDRGGINAYAYCSGNPVDRVDPTGGFAVPLLMMGVGFAMGAGALAAPAASGGRGDRDSTTAWIIGSVVAAAGVIAFVGTLGRSWARNASGKSASTTQSTATPSPTPSTSSAVQASQPQRAYVEPSSRSAGSTRVLPPEGHQPVPPHVTIGRDRKHYVYRKDLDNYVLERVEEIRRFAPRGTSPDINKVFAAEKYINVGKLPPDNTGNFYHRYPIFWGTGHGYESWRIVTGGTFKGGFNSFYLTWDHYKSFVKIADWGPRRSRR